MSGKTTAQERADRLFQAVSGFLARSLKPRDDKLKALELRLAALETEKRLRWRGIWQPDQEYHPGDCVTHASTLWFCHQSVTGDRPAETKKWQQMAKPR